MMEATLRSARWRRGKHNGIAISRFVNSNMTVKESASPLLEVHRRTGSVRSMAS